MNRGWQSVRLVEPSAHVVVDTAVPFGQPSKLVSDDWVRGVRSTMRPAVSSGARDPQTGELFVSVAVPVTREGRLWYILSARILASEFTEILRRQQAPADGVLALLDANLTLVARTRSEDLYLGRNRPTISSRR